MYPQVAHLRHALPAANLIRFVGVLWKDSIKESDGLECSTEDASNGYLDPECVRYMDALIRQATDAGFWVIIAARAKYAAGWDTRSAPDIFHDASLKRKWEVMWAWVADRCAARHSTSRSASSLSVVELGRGYYSTSLRPRSISLNACVFSRLPPPPDKHTNRIAGYEVMSEPRTKTVPQWQVRDAMRGGCEAVHRADAASLCVVGPRPYYKLWELNEQVLQPDGSNSACGTRSDCF